MKIGGYFGEVLNEQKNLNLKSLNATEIHGKILVSITI